MIGVGVISCLMILRIIMINLTCRESNGADQDNLSDIVIPPAQLEVLKQQWLQDYQANTPFQIPVMDGPPKTVVDDVEKTVLPVECLINEEKTIQCLKDIDDFLSN